MTPERWRTAKEIFDAALGRSSDERSAFLDVACGRDRELRSQVEVLLAAYASHGPESEPVTIAGGHSRGSNRESFAGRMFAHYQLEREIGRGGMGQVYLAQDTRLQRPVALKLLPPDFANDADWILRFQQEALAVSALNHPNIITIHEIGETGGLRFLVTEFVDGETLGDLIAGGRNDPAKVLRIIVQVAEALTAAHEAGIVHRDIKPENIMIRRDGYVKILDFGLAKLSEESTGLNAEARTARQVITTPGLLLGTCMYMSPEQARGLSVDARTDIFSLGVVLYEAVTGHPAFDGATRADVLIAIAGEKPAPLVDYLPEAPIELQQIINRALQKKRDERYQTAAEMRDDLASLRQQLGTNSLNSAAPAPGLGRSLTAAHRIAPITELTRGRNRIAQAVIWGLPLVALVVIAAVGYKWWRGVPSPAFESIQVRRLTSIAQARFGAISPDGKFLGYAVRDESGGSFWLKQLATNSTRVVLPATRSVELYCFHLHAQWTRATVAHRP